jgi:heme-degrading monooxygenase HmoA
MIIRRWQTQIDEARAAEYEEFARRRSVPMFRQQPGFAGALFGMRNGERVVITLWETRRAVDALETSESYQDTVAALESTGFMEGGSSTDVFELQGAVIDPCLIENIATW